MPEPIPSDLADQTLQPSSVESWGQRSKAPTDAGIIIELPSGEVARIHRTLNLPILIQTGRIPNPLSDILRKAMSGGMKDGNDFVAEVQKKGDEQTLAQLLDLITQQMPKIFVEPKVSAPEGMNHGETWPVYLERIRDWEPEPGTLSVWLIDMQDQMFAFSVAQGAPASLERFRKESESAMAAVPPSKPVRKAAKRASKPAKRK